MSPMSPTNATSQLFELPNLISRNQLNHLYRYHYLLAFDRPWMVDWNPYMYVLEVLCKLLLLLLHTLTYIYVPVLIVHARAASPLTSHIIHIIHITSDLSITQSFKTVAVRKRNVSWNRGELVFQGSISLEGQTPFHPIKFRTIMLRISKPQ